MKKRIELELIDIMKQMLEEIRAVSDIARGGSYCPQHNRLLQNQLVEIRQEIEQSD